MGPFWRLKQGDGKWQKRAAPPSACTGLIGRCGAVIRVHGGCPHRERGQSRWGDCAAAGEDRYTRQKNMFHEVRGLFWCEKADRVKREFFLRES